MDDSLVRYTQGGRTVVKYMVSCYRTLARVWKILGVFLIVLISILAIASCSPGNIEYYDSETGVGPGGAVPTSEQSYFGPWFYMDEGGIPDDNELEIPERRFVHDELKPVPYIPRKPRKLSWTMVMVNFLVDTAISLLTKFLKGFNEGTQQSSVAHILNWPDLLVQNIQIVWSMKRDMMVLGASGLRLLFDTFTDWLYDFEVGPRTLKMRLVQIAYLLSAAMTMFLFVTTIETFQKHIGIHYPFYTVKMIAKALYLQLLGWMGFCFPFIFVFLFNTFV